MKTRDEESVGQRQERWGVQERQPWGGGNPKKAKYEGNAGVWEGEERSEGLTLPMGLMSTAYKEKMKELSVLSLICSCLYTQPHPTTIYQYGGEYLLPPCWLGWGERAKHPLTLALYSSLQTWR